jgi:hypothetical protein
MTDPNSQAKFAYTHADTKRLEVLVKGEPVPEISAEDSSDPKPEVLYRILKDRQGVTHMWQIVGGAVAELTPLPEDEKREPGTYDAKFKLIKAEPPPWEGEEPEPDDEDEEVDDEENDE